jgi:hypothetical protein
MTTSAVVPSPQFTPIVVPARSSIDEIPDSADV